MAFSSADNHWMRRALALARRGGLAVRPNPLVGAVIVRDNKLIGHGWHRLYGADHAEIEALATCAKPRGSTLYVTLEPCNHWGKTPPCAEKLISVGFDRVVVATRDPNPRVEGGGARHMIEAGMRVEIGCLANDARELNRGWFSLMETGRPLVAVHLLASLDGRKFSPDKLPKLFEDDLGRKSFRRGLAEFDAILIGSDDDAFARCILEVCGAEVEKKFRRLPESGEKGLKNFLKKCGEERLHSILASGNTKAGELLLEAGICDRLIIRRNLELVGSKESPLFSITTASRFAQLQPLWAKSLGSAPVGKQVVSCYKP